MGKQQYRSVKMQTPLVEIDGDEMTRILWRMIKSSLLEPYIDLKVEYFDLGLKHRDATDDQVTLDAGHAIRKYGVGVKCATITPDAERVREYGLKREWHSPNATLREMLGGTVFRSPVLTGNIQPAVASWVRPIHIARHAFGDVYSNAELRIAGAGTVDLVFTDTAGREKQRVHLHTFKEPGIVQGVYNIDRSIVSFAHACFAYALDRRIDLWFGAKDTISKTYDGRFRDLFERVYRTDWKKRFSEAGLRYSYMLIDDAVARIVKSEGGILWACKNYDGDVMSDMIASAYGSLAMMTSVLMSPDGCWEFEAAHGTVRRHYHKHMAGERTSTNPIALIFAWTGALKKRAERDSIPDLISFAQKLEEASLKTVRDGVMTDDLFRTALPNPANTAVSSEEFIRAVKTRLEYSLLSAGDSCRISPT